MKYFIIAGEASGDLHGSNLIKGIREVDPSADIVCWGGDLMEKNGGQLLMHYRELAVMGFWEVLINLGKLSSRLSLCKKQIIGFKPDVVILIDYPGFNLRIAEYLKGRIDNVYYYISPKVWAWKSSRIKKIKEYISRMYVIFPFETEFFKEHNLDVKYYGNPLVDTVRDELDKVPSRKEFLEANGLDERPLVALLAGSRVQEVEKILPEMIKVKDYYLDYQFVIAGVKNIPVDVYDNLMADTEVNIIYDQTWSLYAHSEAALVASGTATLEAALAGVPQVVCYRANPISYLIARMFVKLRFISLVNLIMDKELVKELIQGNMTHHKMNEELRVLLPGGWKRDVMLQGYRLLKDKLSGEGASLRVAEDIYNSLILVNNVN